MARGGIALGIALLLIVPVLVRWEAGTAMATVATAGVVYAAAYELSYVVLTLIVYQRATLEQLGVVAESWRPGSWWNRWVALNEPGSPVALSMAVAAMGAAIFVLPRVDRFAGVLPAGVLLLAAVGLVVGAWATMVVTYAVDYALTYLHEGGLSFPGQPPERFADFLYLSVVTSASFGTADVKVSTPAMRRKITGHTVLAFGFNAIILALTFTAVN
jgi:uncharacterized membrane protein